MGEDSEKCRLHGFRSDFMRRLMLSFAMAALIGLSSVSCTGEADVSISRSFYTNQVSSSHETERIPVVINQNSGTYHLDASCLHAKRIAEDNKLLITVPDETYLTAHGYTPCKTCSDTKNTNRNVETEEREG